MANEVAVLPEFNVDFKPSKITISNLDVLTKTIDQYAKKYDGLIVTDDTEKDVKNKLAEIRKVSTSLDDERKAVKKKYNEPLTEFENQIKDLTEKLGDVIKPINDGLTQLDNKRRDELKKKVLDDIFKIAPNYGVLADEVPFDDRWLNKSMTNNKRLEQITDVMKMIHDQKERLNQNIETITKYAEAREVDSSGWIDQIKQGSSVPDVITRIDSAVEQAKKKAEYDKAMAEVNTTTTASGKQVDEETGEIVNNEPEPQPEEPERSVDLRITCTIEKMKQLKSLMDANGIKYKKIGG